MNDTVWMMDMDFRTTYSNPSVAFNRGYSLEELRDLPLEKSMAPDSYRIAAGAMAEDLTPERLYDPNVKISRTMELEFCRKDGSTFWGEINVTLLRDADGRPSGFLGVGRNTTERREAEEALRESEERYRKLLEIAPVGIAVQSEGKIVFTNMEGAKILGAGSPDEITGRDIKQIIHPDYLKDAEDRIKRMLSGEEGLYPAENVYVRLDGTAVPVDVLATPLTYRGKPAVQVIVTDISRRKEAELALRESEQRYRELVENIADIVYVTNEQGKITFLNSAAEEFIGRRREEVIGRSFADFLAPGSLETAADVFSAPARR